MVTDLASGALYLRDDAVAVVVSVDLGELGWCRIHYVHAHTGRKGVYYWLEDVVLDSEVLL